MRASLRAEPETALGPSDADAEEDFTTACIPTMAEMTDRHFRAALDRTGKNVSAAAGLLGLHRSTVHEWLRRRRRATGLVRAVGPGIATIEAVYWTAWSRAHVMVVAR